MTKILRKMLMVGLMACGSAAMYPAAAPMSMEEMEEYEEIKAINQDVYKDLPEEKQAEVIDTLVRIRGGNVQQAFFGAVKANEVWVLAPLIQRGARPDAVDEEGMSALHRAVMGAGCSTSGSRELGSLDSVKFLVEECGVNIDVANVGWTALHRALCAHHNGVLDIVSYLLSAGADIESSRVTKVNREKRDMTVLEFAINCCGIYFFDETRALRTVSMVIAEYRKRLARKYPVMGCGAPIGEATDSSAGLDLLPLELVEAVMNDLSVRDWQSVACVSRAHRALAYDVMNRKYPVIKKEKFEEYLGSALRYAREANKDRFVALLEHELSLGCEHGVGGQQALATAQYSTALKYKMASVAVAVLAAWVMYTRG